MPAPTISLCLIARDEEQFLPGCLASVEGVVDQIVVVDTGSTDRTVALAEAAGAQVVHNPWQEDFSQARNASLAVATGDYVLILDADERLAPGAGKLLKAVVAAGTVDCGMMPLHNAKSLDTSLAEVVRTCEPVLLPRLLRRTPDLRYEGVVHEHITTWMVDGNRNARRIDAAIVHYGCVAHVREVREKDARNLRLLERRCAESPGDLVARGYLARELLRVGEEERAIEEGLEGWAAMGVAMEGDGPKPTFVSLATVLAHTYIQRGEVSPATEILDQAKAWGARHPNLELLRGWSLESIAVGRTEQDREHLRKARSCYEACIQAHGQRFAEETMPGATTWVGQTRLGTVCLRLGEPDKALPCFETALEQQGGFTEAMLGKTEALTALGRAPEALLLVESLLQETPDGWLLAAQGAIAVGGLDDAGDLLKRAVELASSGFIAPHRRSLLLELRSLHGLLMGRPVAGPGWSGLLGAIVGRQPAEDHPEKGFTPPEGEFEVLLERWLQRSRSDLLEPLLERRADSLMPGLTARTIQALADKGIDVADDGEPEFVFIGGAGRSGTTLLRAMLDAHPRIACGPELKLVPTICALRDQWWSSMGHDLMAAGLDESKLDAAVRAFVKTLLESMVEDPSEVRVAEKTPHNLLHMALLGRIFPRARFVHIVRDGRAVAASLVRQGWMDPATSKPIWYCKDVASGARYWSQVVRSIRQQVSQVPGRFLEVRYEDLVREPRATMERLLAFLGESWNEGVLSHHDQVRVSTHESSSAAVAQPLTTDAIERWRQELGPDELRAIGQEAGALLLEWEAAGG